MENVSLKSVVVVLEWKKNRMYGLCPHAFINNAEVAKSIGCGYDKTCNVMSHVICDYLKLSDDRSFIEGNFNLIERGQKSIQGVFIEKIAESPSTDAYKILYRTDL